MDAADGPYRIARALHFCYGHRLLDHPGPCRFLHGHNARVEIELAAGRLDDRGMVRDFDEVKRTIGAWIDTELDHRMILERRDPLAQPIRERGEPVFLMDVPPTAENLARLLFVRAREEGLPVAAVRFWETPFSMAEVRSVAD